MDDEELDPLEVYTPPAEEELELAASELELYPENDEPALLVLLEDDKFDEVELELAGMELD